MPHQCTTCGHVFPDGSTEMLSGCPECGGNAFQFYPDGADVPDEPPDVEPPGTDTTVGGPVGRAASTVRDLVGGRSGPPPADGGAPAGPSAADDQHPGDQSGGAWPGERENAAQAAARGSTGGGQPGDDIIVADESEADGTEDDAQTSARTDLASAADVPGRKPPGAAGDADDGVSTETVQTETSATPPTTRGRVVSEPTGETPDLAELREQLNDQFESIKIVEPGEYELNLMELYEREEYIIALQENGRYVIQMPDTWIDDDGDED